MNFLLVPKYGMIGASIATFLTFLTQFGFFYIFFQKLYFIPYKMINSLIIISITFILYYFVIFLIKDIEMYIIVTLVKIMGLVFFVYFLFVYFRRDLSVNYLLEKFKIDF